MTNDYIAGPCSTHEQDLCQGRTATHQVREGLEQTATTPPTLGRPSPACAQRLTRGRPPHPIDGRIAVNATTRKRPRRPRRRTLSMPLPEGEGTRRQSMPRGYAALPGEWFPIGKRCARMGCQEEKKRGHGDAGEEKVLLGYSMGSQVGSTTQPIPTMMPVASWRSA